MHPNVREAAHGMHCPICGSIAVAASFHVETVPSTRESFSIMRCSHCGVGWTAPPVPASELQNWYPPTYYGKQSVRFNAVIEMLVRFSARRRAQLVARYSSPGPVLDVGCGRGCTLSALGALGYEPLGVELNETAAWHAKHRFGIEVHVGDFLTAPYTAGQFAAIIFWHSLEHLDRPAEAIRHAYELLRPGGLLVVAVPNAESLQARWGGRHWFHLDIPRHYFHFGVHSLHALLTSSGFRIIKTSHLSLEQSPYGWLQTMYNAMGPQSNLLYSLLKNPTARSIPIGRHAFQLLMTLVTLPILLPLSFMLACVEAALQRGGTIDVYAVK